jgi:hypothetical protein
MAVKCLVQQDNCVLLVSAMCKCQCRSWPAHLRFILKHRWCLSVFMRLAPSGERFLLPCDAVHIKQRVAARWCTVQRHGASNLLIPFLGVRV